MEINHQFGNQFGFAFLLTAGELPILNLELDGLFVKELVPYHSCLTYKGLLNYIIKPPGHSDNVCLKLIYSRLLR